MAIHAVVISELGGGLVAPEAPAPGLTAELQKIEPPPPPPPPRPSPPAVTKPKPVSQKVAPASPSPSPPTPPAPHRADRSLAGPPAPPAEEKPADAGSAEQSKPTVDTAAAPPEPPPEPQVAEARAGTPDPLPARGTITYDLLYGGGIIGRSEQHWRIEGTAYRLSSLSETTGLLSVFLPYQFAYVSEGTVGPEGLRPRSCSPSRRWLRIGRTKMNPVGDAPRSMGAARALRAPGHPQDLLSFIFQLAREPMPPGQRMMVITAGHKLDTYVLDIGMEQPIELPIGTIRTVPIRQVSAPGEEHMELWLAADPPRLPVRIRFFDRGGNLTVEQIATRIDTHGT